MASITSVFAAALGLSAALLAATPAAAANSTAQCEAMLIDAGPVQEALEQMERALTENAAHLQALDLEMSTLAQTIAERRADGATKAELQPLLTQHGLAADEREGAEALTPMLQRQRDALAIEVDAAERGYISCIESALQ